jgi:hypothetical protein
VSAPVQRRIEAPENIASSADGNIRIVFAEPGETAEQAREREGAMDTENVIVVIFG